MSNTRVSSKASPEANATPDAVPAPNQGPGHKAILLAISKLGTELLTKAEAQSSEILNHFLEWDMANVQREGATQKA